MVELSNYLSTIIKKGIETKIETSVFVWVKRGSRKTGIPKLFTVTIVTFRHELSACPTGLIGSCSKLITGTCSHLYVQNLRKDDILFRFCLSVRSSVRRSAN